MRGRTGVLAILCLVAGCSGKADGNAVAAATPRAPTKPAPPAISAHDDRYRTLFTPAVSMATWYPAGAYRVRSRAPAVAIAPATDLPLIRHEPGDNAFCPDPRPETPEGKWAQSRGWQIGSEDTLGPLTIVTVLRKFINGSGGECVAIDGRSLVFDHGKPIASIVTVSVDGFQLARSEETERGAIRLIGAIEAAPYGDLVVKGRDIEIEPLPPSDTACHGKQIVPNIFGQPIQVARRILRRAGWRPVPTRRHLPVLDDNGMGDGWDGADYLYADGITEVTECEPHGQCSLGYRTRGATSTVVTESGTVTWYWIDCAGV